MNILALDPGLSMGWASLNGERLKAGEWNLNQYISRKEKVTINTWARRCARLYNELDNSPTGRPKKIIVERIHSQHGPDVLTQRLIGTVLMWVNNNGGFLVECSPRAWKAALGGASMGKDQYRKAVQACWGLSELPGEDEAAALGMLWWARSRFGK